MAVVNTAQYTSPIAPSADIVDIMESGLVEITRRVEFYESDATTRWYPAGQAAEQARLVDGAVTVDYGSDERRKLDLTLSNSDQLLRPNPNGGLWYDKVIKIYRGVKFDASATKTPTAIIEAVDDASAAKFSALLAGLGYDDNDILLGNTDVTALLEYSQIASVLTTGTSAVSDLLKQLFYQGRTIITVGTGNGTPQLPHYSTTSGTPPTKNYARDPGFENSAPWSGIISRYVRDNTVSRSGAWSMKSNPTPVSSNNFSLTGGSTLNDTLAIGAGVTVTVKVRYKTTSDYNGTSANGKLRIGDQAGTILTGPQFLVNTNWTTLTATYTQSAAVTGVQITIVSDHTVGAIWYDDIEVTLSSGPVEWGVAPAFGDNPAAGAFVKEAAGPGAGVAPTALAAGATAVSVYPTANPEGTITGSFIRSPAGGWWFDLHVPSATGTEAKKLLKTMLNYMKFGTSPIKTWEAQLGEFYIDGISSPYFPHQTKITARDATKKMMNSKLSRTSTFVAGTSLYDFVVGQASLSGIPTAKMKINIGNEVLAQDMSFDKGTSRWEMVKSALESFNYERFFDGQGFFVVRQYLDPSTSPVTWRFGTGPDGNLVEFEKSVNDSRIYNHVIVNSTPSGSDVLPYFGEAVVTDASAPTNPSRIGDRVLPVDADWLSSDAECQQLAEDRLKITALESYELSFSSIYYPWLECGEIIEIDDPDALSFEPNKFLMDSISYPLGLGPMSATGKRVTFVGSSGGS